MNDTCLAKRPYMRFSIASLLLLMTCVGGYLTGYRSGYEAGDSTWHYGSTYTGTYNIADLIQPKPVLAPNRASANSEDFDDLISIVAPVGIDQPKDECEIRPFPANLSLVVTGNGIVHRRIAALLNELRRPATHAKGEKTASSS